VKERISEGYEKFLPVIRLTATILKEAWNMA
jgi:hypothetical protein